MMSDARRAVVWLMALAAVVVAGDHLLATALRQVLLRSQFRYSRLYRGGNEADVVILGDSRGVHSFYAPALEQLTGLRAFNLSYNSMSPRVAEAVLLDYLERNRAPRIVVIEPTCVIVAGAVKSELRTFGAFSPRLEALYAEEHPVAAKVERVLWLYPLNSTFFLEALHYARRSDQDWIYHDAMPPGLRAPQPAWRLAPIAGEVDALARIVAMLRQRGIEVRLVFAPYAPVKTPTNAAEFAAFIECRTGARVWSYAAAISDLDSFADTVHLNERGSRALLAMLVRDGCFAIPGRFSAWLYNCSGRERVPCASRAPSSSPFSSCFRQPETRRRARFRTRRSPFRALRATATSAAGSRSPPRCRTRAPVRRTPGRSTRLPGWPSPRVRARAWSP